MEISVRNARAKSDKQKERLLRAQRDHAGMMGTLLLRAGLEDLRHLGRLPDALERLGLAEARMAVLFAMGDEEILRKEGSIPENETGEEVERFFETWHDRGTDLELTRDPDFVLGDVATLSSHVLGCHVELQCERNLVSIGVGEAILGTLEALLATSLTHRMLPHLDHLRIRVVPKDGMGLVPQLEFHDERGITIGTIQHAPEMIYGTKEDLLSFPNWLKDAALEILLKFVTPSDVESWGRAVFGEENAFSRALTFSNVPMMLGSLLGDHPKLSTTDWIESNDAEYPVTRLSRWPPQKEAEEEPSPSAFGEGSPPDSLFDLERKRHSDMKVVSPIDVHKWDKARWDAALFMVVPGHDEIAPVLGLAYKHREPAIAIFEGWRERFGNDDPRNDLRIAIIRGISAAAPFAYAVIVGANPDNIPTREGSLFEFVSRIQHMYPSSGENLERFLETFRHQGRYFLVPAHFPTRKSEPEPLFKYGIGKYDLVVRDAWEIGENDPDSVVLDLDDPPIIPEDKPDAPVVRALARKREYLKRDR